MAGPLYARAASAFSPEAGAFAKRDKTGRDA